MSIPVPSCKSIFCDHNKEGYNKIKKNKLRTNRTW